MAPRTKQSIMVIGFDEDFCYLMQRFGRISAHTLVIANHDDEALAQVRKAEPGIIFLEIVHPGTFALDLIQQLKNQPDTCHIPIIMCSWQSEEQYAEQARADFFLRLPILYADFESALDHVVGFSEDTEK